LEFNVSFQHKYGSDMYIDVRL